MNSSRQINGMQKSLNILNKTQVLLAMQHLIGKTKSRYVYIFLDGGFYRQKYQSQLYFCVRTLGKRGTRPPGMSYST